MGILQIYLPGRIHLISMIIAVSSILLSYYLHPKTHPIYRFMNAMLINVFAHFMYENIFTAFYRASGYGTDTGTLTGIKLYWAFTILLGDGLIYSNSKYGFINKRKWGFLLILGTILFVILGNMYYSGWFAKLYDWFQGGPDPPNLSWALSKATGFFMWSSLVGNSK